jgi:acetolactate synthase I/II/III large subunit
MQTASEYVADFLVGHGIPYVVGIPGHGNLTLFDAFAGRSDITPLMVRHEQSAIHLADGYTRLTGVPLLATTSCGPGAVNTLVGLATAMADSIPVLLITGNVQNYYLERGAIQDISFHRRADFTSMVAPVVKRSWSLSYAAELPETLHRAYQLAVTGRPGPVHIELPMDVQAADLPAGHLSPQRRAVPSAPYPDPASIRNAAALLVSARRPVALVGGGVSLARAEAELLELIEYLGIPVVTTLTSKGSIPEDHPLNAYYTGQKGAKVGHETVREADLLLALGYRFTEWASGSYRDGEVFSIPPQRVIQIDIDPATIGLYYPVEVAIVGDVRSALTCLNAEVQSMTPRRQYEVTPDFMTLQERREEWARTLSAQLSDGRPISLSRALGELRAALPRDGVVLASSGHTQGHLFQEFPVYLPRTHLSAGGFSTMGWGVPAAIGAKLAEPGRPVVAVVGDGDFLMTCQEIATAAQYGIPTVFFVVNNSGYLSIRDMQISIFGKERVIATEDRDRGGRWLPPDIGGLGRSLGAQAFTIEDPTQIADAVKLALAHDGPTVIEVRTAADFPRSMNSVAGFSEFPSPSRVQGTRR